MQPEVIVLGSLKPELAPLPQVVQVQVISGELTTNL